MLRSRQRRLVVIAATVGVALAVLLGVLAMPRWSSSPPVEVVLFEPMDPTAARAWTPPPPPPPAPPQPVPPPETFEAEDTDSKGLTFEQLRDRADWNGGAVVTCDLSAFGAFKTASINLGEGLGLGGAVDVLSRLAPVIDGYVRIVVNEPQGRAQGFLLTEEAVNSRIDELRDLPLLTLSWRGAEPGTTVGCDAVDVTASGSLRVTVNPPHDEPHDADGNPLTKPILILRGCGSMWPVVAATSEISVEPGTCTMHVERRNRSWPLAIARGPPVMVRLGPGDTVDVTLDAPPEPSAWQPPDLDELMTISDVAGWAGNVAISNAIEELVASVQRGDWDPDLLNELIAERSRGDAGSQGAELDEAEGYEDEWIDTGEPVPLDAP